MYNFNFNESDMLSKSQNENILDDSEIIEDKEDFDYEDFVQQAIASGDLDTLILINELEIEEDKDDDSSDDQEVIEDDESFSIVEKDGQRWKVLSTAKGKYNAARKYNECITKAKNEVRLVSLKDLEKMNESRKNEAPANPESLFTALMSELNTMYKCEITDEGFLRCTDDSGNFIEVATIKNTDPVEMGMRVNFTDGTQSETVYYVYDNIQAVNDFIQAVFISEVNAFNDMNEVEAEEVQKEEKEDVELEDENQAQEEIDKNVEEVEEESEEEKTESLKRKLKNESDANLGEVEVEYNYTESGTTYLDIQLGEEKKYRFVGSIEGIMFDFEADDFGEAEDIINDQLAENEINLFSTDFTLFNESKKKSLNEDVIPAVYDSLIIRYKDSHNKEDFDELVNIIKNIRKTATFITDNDIREDLEGWRFPKEDVDEIIGAIKIDKNESSKDEFKIKVTMSDGREKFYKAKDLDAAKRKFSELCIRFNNCELLQGDKVLYKQNESLNEKYCVKSGDKYICDFYDADHVYTTGWAIPSKDNTFPIIHKFNSQDTAIQMADQLNKIRQKTGLEPDEYEVEILNESLTKNEPLNEGKRQDILDKISKEVYDKIAEVYDNDSDLMEYVYVEPKVIPGHYDDGTDWHGIEVRAEQSYGGMMELAEKLDPIVRKYDKYAYFDMEDSGIMSAAINLDRIKESLNEDGTVSDMGVPPIMPADLDNIDDSDDDDELFTIDEGFLFPDAEEETDEDKEEEVNSLMGAAIEDINQGQPTASEWIEDAQYVFNSIKDDTVKNRLRNKYSQYLESKKNESSDDELGLYIINTRRMYDKYCSPAMDKIRQGKEDEVDWFKIAIEGAKMYAREIEPLHLNKEDYRRTADYIRDYYINLAGDPQNESAQKNEASVELNKVIKELAANDKTDVEKEINKLYKTEPDAKSNVADGSPILGATSPDNIVPTIDKAIMNKAIFAATSYANNGPQMFAKLQESFKNIDRKTIDDLMNSKDVAGIAKYLYESEMHTKLQESFKNIDRKTIDDLVNSKDIEGIAKYLYESLNEDTFTDPQMNVVNSNSTTVATGNSPETPKLADDIDPAPTEVQDLPKDKSEIENTDPDNKEDQLAKDSGTEDIPTI